MHRIAAALAALLVSAPAAAANLLTDGFEADGFGLTQTSLVNFTATSGNVDVVGPSFFGIACAGGAKCIDLDGTNTGGPTTLTSRNSFAFLAGQTVTLSFALSGNQRPGNGGPSDGFSAGFDFGGNTALTNYGFNFGGAPVNLGPNLISGFSVGASVTPTSPFATRSIFFTAGQAGTFTFALGTDSADDYGPVLDNVSLDNDATAVPEPATWAMLIGGVGLTGGALRRRRGTVRLATA